MDPMKIDPNYFEPPPPERRVFCNRTLNLRSIRAVGFDMDYTLIHYRIEVWEQRAYEHAKQRLLERGWPFQNQTFDRHMAERGLVIDKELGNLVKADRFGYVKRAAHGSSMLSFDEQRRAYLNEIVDLREPRWAFLNTLFSLSVACLYAQAVDLLDQGQLPSALGYGDLYEVVRASVDEAHMMGQLKGEIVAAPDDFVELDPDLPQALLDLKEAGKKILLITNSDWAYTKPMMAYAFDRFLPPGLTSWRELFDLVIVFARKPQFFSQQNPIFRVVGDEGLLEPVAAPDEQGKVYFGGDATTVEEYLGLSGSEILYVGDHIFADVTLSKSLLRWRTALVVREMERELREQARFEATQQEIHRLMAEKVRLERAQARVRLQMQRTDQGSAGPRPAESTAALRTQLHELRTKLTSVDDELAPLVQKSSTLGNARWGLTMRAGNDKSHLARQIERYADVYLSRVSNFGLISPYAYLRAPRSSLPHDPLADDAS
jgi:HAD superfamily 5'-nucleotidase-like hydrolase